MTLTDEEYKEYLDGHLHLLHFVGKELNIISTNVSFEEFLDLDLEIKFQCRQGFADNKKLVDEYLELHSDQLSENQIKLLKGFKRQLKKKFIILKCLTNHAIFMDTMNNDLYAVKALGDPFDYFFDSFPVIISTTILPFKDKIIYDGFFETPVMYIGSNMKKSLLEDYKIAKSQGNIILTIK